MGLLHNRVCDGCNSIVHGLDRRVFVHIDYIEIKGQMVLQLEDAQTKYREHIYLTQKPREGEPMQDLTFCLKEGLPCLQLYIDFRKSYYHANRGEVLKKQATREHLTRMDSSSFTVGNKKNH